MKIFLINGVYRTVLDGEHYKQNEFLTQNPTSLAIIFYYDELGVVNPLGANSKPNNLSVFYWLLANIDPRFRSNKNDVRLHETVKTSFIKKHGI